MRFSGVFPEPAVSRMVAQDVGALRRTQERSPRIQNRLDVDVDLVVDEPGPAAGRRHRPVQDRIERESDETGFVEARRMSQDHVEQPQHMLVVAHLRQPEQGFLLVRRNFVEHLVEKHVGLGVGFDEILQIFDDRQQRTRVLLRLVHDFLHPVDQRFAVPGHPLAGCKRLVDRFDRCAHDDFSSFGFFIERRR